MNPVEQFHDLLQRLPLVAILRGVQPHECAGVGAALVEAGFGVIEVPLNSPDPLRSIELLARAHPQALVGAGTVLTSAEVRDVHAAGGRLVVAPNFEPTVVREALRLEMACVPGVMTPSEAFAALAARATALKLFPAEAIAPAAVKALRAVLPADTLLLPVGGITTANLRVYRAAGASGFGIGSALYQPGLEPAEVLRRARDFQAACGGTIRA